MLQDFEGRTAVVTGAASGIGLGLVRRCRARGMRVAMLDVEPAALHDAAATVGGADDVLALTVDVSDPAEVEAAAASVTERFGAVHLLCNNAGVSITGPLWRMTPDDVRWVTGVNLLGVTNGFRSFVSRMVDGGEPGHVVSTSSLAGLTPMPYAGLYSGTKAAVVALSEALLHDLRDAGAAIGVSVLCPGLVNTNILRSLRNRPADAVETGEGEIPEESHAFFALGTDPLEVADRVLHAVEHDTFYVLTNEAGRPDIAARMQAMVELGQPPRPTAGSIMPDRPS
jgi:NAD(P)-dependent dehydrogenase (short-subunit alcohol dehydrogenase family)